MTRRAPEPTRAERVLTGWFPLIRAALPVTMGLGYALDNHHFSDFIFFPKFSGVAPLMGRQPFAADDYPAIGARLKELEAERQARHAVADSGALDVPANWIEACGNINDYPIDKIVFFANQQFQNPFDRTDLDYQNRTRVFNGIILAARGWLRRHPP